MLKVTNIFSVFRFCWLFFATQTLVSFTQAEQLDNVNPQKVCLFVWTRLSADLWDDSYTNKFFEYMDNVLFQSIARQCTNFTQCTSITRLKVVVRIDGHNETQNELLVNHLKKLSNKHTHLMWYKKRAKSRWQVYKQLGDIVSQDTCLWVSYIYVDADDAFLDGFFHYVSTKIPDILNNDKNYWRGALFVSRDLPGLVVGNNKCVSGKYVGYKDKSLFFAGLSPGQGFILRRWIWRTLKRKVQPSFLHPKFVKVTREFIMHNLGYANYTSVTSKNYKLGFITEKKDSRESQLLLIDLTVNWTTSGILIHTPFSSHYPWAYHDKMPTCTQEQMAKIDIKFPKDIWWLLSAAERVHITMKEVCKNNMYLEIGKRKHLGCELLPKLSSNTTEVL